MFAVIGWVILGRASRTMSKCRTAPNRSSEGCPARSRPTCHTRPRPRLPVLGAGRGCLSASRDSTRFLRRRRTAPCGHRLRCRDSSCVHDRPTKRHVDLSSGVSPIALRVRAGSRRRVPDHSPESPRKLLGTPRAEPDERDESSQARLSRWKRCTTWASERDPTLVLNPASVRRLGRGSSPRRRRLFRYRRRESARDGRLDRPAKASARVPRRALAPNASRTSFVSFVTCWWASIRDGP
jgi:hypothetical protein